MGNTRRHPRGSGATPPDSAGPGDRGLRACQRGRARPEADRAHACSARARVARRAPRGSARHAARPVRGGARGGASRGIRWERRRGRRGALDAAARRPARRGARLRPLRRTGPGSAERPTGPAGRSSAARAWGSPGSRGRTRRSFAPPSRSAGRARPRPSSCVGSGRVSMSTEPWPGDRLRHPPAAASLRYRDLRSLRILPADLPDLHVALERGNGLAARPHRPHGRRRSSPRAPSRTSSCSTSTAASAAWPA